MRIQSDRGQHVISSGHYAYIRHPGYFAMLIFLPSLALMLGSGLSLWFTLGSDLLLIVRMALEDQTLRCKLAGYAEYCLKVRYRLVPGIW